VFRGIEGFGSSGRVHTNRILSLAAKLPAMVVIIDTAEKIDEFLPQLDEMDVRGIVAVDDVEIVWPGHVPESAR
jgi:PII-like signaling protein